MHSRKILRHGLALAAFAVCLAASAVAQEYQILRADYGYGNQRVDVTQRLRELARADRTFRMGNSTFGVDPSPGNVKSLRIIARDPNGGGERVFEYQEGSVVDGSQFSGWSQGNWGTGGLPGGGGGYPGPGGGGYPGGGDSGEYQILRADYGYGNQRVDVTQRLRELARADRTFRMGNSTFGVDPSPGNVKSLRIIARNPNGGGEQIFEYQEGSTVDGSRFTGWSGGNWGGGLPGGGGGYPGPGGGYPGGGGAGEYQILRAFYGYAGRNVDVTQRLRELARSDNSFRMGNSTFGIDPAPGHVKTLRIYARDPRSGRDRMFEYREGSTVDGSQFSGWGAGNWGDNNWNGGWQGRPGNGDGDADDVGNYPGNGNNRNRFTIIRATYGAPGQTRDVTGRLRSEVRNGRLNLRVDNDSMGGDPAPGSSKRLLVNYSFRGQQRRANVREGGQVNIP